MSLIKPKIQAPQASQDGKLPSYHLDGAPDVPALTDYLHQVMDHQADVLELRWASEQGDGGFYSLILRAPGSSGEVKWSFFLASGLLWEYVSCDVLLIHNMVSMACDKHGQIVHGEGLLATSDVYRNVKRSPDTYYIRTETPSDYQTPAGAEPSVEIEKSPAATIVPKPIDASLIEGVMLKLRDAQTGLYTYPTFLYFLEQAYFQSCRTQAPISIALIELSKGSGQGITKDEVFKLVTHLTATKRRTDMLAQYESGNIVVLAPATDHAGAKIFGRRLFQTLEVASLSEADKQIAFSIGVASFPKDGESLGMLLATAEAAKNYAKSSGTHIAAREDIK